MRAARLLAPRDGPVLRLLYQPGLEAEEGGEYLAYSRIRSTAEKVKGTV